MRRIVSRHLGIWVLAGALFIGLGVASAMPNQDRGVDQFKENIYAPRQAITAVQDKDGMFFGFRNALAGGAM